MYLFLQELNDDYTRSVASSARSRTGRRDLKNEDVIHNLDKIAGRNSSRMKELVDHSNEESSQSVTKFDELMKRLKTTAAAHKVNIAKDNAESSTTHHLPADAKSIDEPSIITDKNVEEEK